MTEHEQLYNHLSEIRSQSQFASRLAGKLLTQNDVDCVDRIANIANQLIGRLMKDHDKRRDAIMSRADGI